MLNAVFKTIDDRRDDYVTQLQTLCRQPSVGAHGGEQMARTADMVEGMVRKVGAETVQFPTKSFPIVFGEVPGKSERIISCYNHYDVQPPEPLGPWTTDPFGAEIRDGLMFARGVADDKGELLARVFAVDAWRRTHGQPPVGVKFVFEGNEETGSPDLPAFARKHSDRLQADGCIWEYGDKDPAGVPQMYLGLKGICVVQLRARGPASDTHSMWGPIVPNPMWQLIWALHTLKNRHNRITIDGFYDRVRAPTPTDLAALEPLPFDEDGWRKKHGIASFVEADTKLEVLRRLNFEPALSIHGISGGGTGRTSTTSIPATATVKMDFRLVPNQRVDDTVRLLRAHLEHEGCGDIEVELFSGSNPTRTALDDPLVVAAVRSARTVYGVEPAVHPSSSGSGPMYSLCESIGIPAISLGIAHAGSNFHGPDENIRLDDFILGIKHIAAMFLEFADQT